MANGTFEEHLIQADTAVQHANWQGAIQSLKQAQQIEPEHTAVLTALGTCYIQLDQADQAVGYFEQVARLAPDVFEAHNNLGVIYTLTQQYSQAEQAYRRALEIDGENLAAWKNLAQACLQQETRLAEGVQILASLVQSHPEDSGVLLMMATVYLDGGDLNSAELFFQQVTKIDPENQDAAAGLAQVAELRAKQARIARPEHAKKLAALKGLKKSVEAASDVQKQNAAYLTGSSYSSLRMKRVFQEMGWPVTGETFKTEFSRSDLNRVDFAVFSQPNLSGELVQAVNAFLEAGKPFGVDLEQDFFHMPSDHPAYHQFGPGNSQALKMLELILAKAAWVSVPSNALAEQLKPYCGQVKLVLPGWDSTNPLWKKTAPKRNALHVGWVGSTAEHADLLTIKMDLIKFMRATPQAVLVFAGDEDALKEFGGLSEKRKIFLPAADADEIPYVLSQFDILIVPWRDIPYNRAKSDLALVEAAARSIPWVASPIPAYREWGVGGILVEKPGEWSKVLEGLVGSKEMRNEIVKAGYQKVNSRIITAS